MGQTFWLWPPQAAWAGVIVVSDAAKQITRRVICAFKIFDTVFIVLFLELRLGKNYGSPHELKMNVWL